MSNIRKFNEFINEKRLEDRVVSASDLLKSIEDEEMLEFDGIYEELFGQPSKDFDMGIFGAPGAGKTIFLLKFAKYFANNFGKVLYISSEEFGSVTLIQKLKDISMKEDNLGDDKKKKFKVPKNLFFGRGLTDLTDYDLVIIDSLTDMDIDVIDYKELRDIYPDTAFIAVLQSTKKGDYRGGKDFEHEFEIFCEIEDGVVETTKNRYGQYGIVDVFNNVILTDKKE